MCTGLSVRLSWRVAVGFVLKQLVIMYSNIDGYIMCLCSLQIMTVRNYIVILLGLLLLKELLSSLNSYITAEKRK